MLETIRKEFNRKQRQIKGNPIFCQYLKYIGISIILGICLEFKFFEYLFGRPVPLINQFLNTSNSSPIDHLLVFSTSASILSTIFTIIFVLLTVFIQVSDLSVSTEIFRNGETKNLVRLYFTTIILSLIMLETTSQYPILVLILTFACILSLYPFLCNISDKLEYDIALRIRTEKIISLIDSNKESLALGRIVLISNTCKRSVKDNRLNFFLETTSFFKNLTKMAKQKEMTDLVVLIGNEYLEILKYSIEIKLKTTHWKTMIMSLFRLIKSHVSDYSDILKFDDISSQASDLKEIGVMMIKDGLDDIYVRQIIKSILNDIYIMQNKIISEQDNIVSVGNWEYKFYIEPDIISYIGELATESYNKKKEPSALIIFVIAFVAIGAKTCQLSEKLTLRSPFTQSTVIEQLIKIEKIIGTDHYEKLFKGLIDSVKYDKLFHGSDFFTDSEHKTYLDKFKASYDSNKIEQKVHVDIFE